MSLFILIPLCHQHRHQFIDRDAPHLLPQNEKVALIGDIVLVALALITATLIYLANTGVNLGIISRIGSIGNIAAYCISGCSGFIMVIDLIKLCVICVKIQKEPVNEQQQVIEDIHNTVTDSPIPLTTATENGLLSLHKTGAPVATTYTIDCNTMKLTPKVMDSSLPNHPMGKYTCYWQSGKFYMKLAFCGFKIPDFRIVLTETGFIVFAESKTNNKQAQCFEYAWARIFQDDHQIKEMERRLLSSKITFKGGILTFEI